MITLAVCSAQKTKPHRTDAWGAYRKGTIRVRTEKRDAVLLASLKGGVVLQTQHRDTNTEIQRLDRNATCEDAPATSKLAGDLSLGIVPCGEHCALRFAFGNRREILARIRPDMTRTCGREVMLADS